MSNRPVIGIPTQTLHAIEGISTALPASWVMSQRYFHATTAVGGVPWMIPLLDDDMETLREIYERLDGVLIPGGVDIDPLNFGEARRPECGVVDPARDVVELQLARWAADDKKPLLGLCRGLQVINVALGGTLYQDIGADMPGALKHDCFPTQGYARDYRAHDVSLSPGSRVRAAFDTASIAVNSMHHQGIKDLAPRLLASAAAPDGLIEAVESSNGHFLVGVQWHQEVYEAVDAPTRRLFASFIAAAQSRRQSIVRPSAPERRTP
jgi:putative glutamine amidotransferase